MAQSTTPARAGKMSWYFGGGPTFSKFTSTLNDESKLLVGAQVALGAQLPLTGNFSIVPEVNVSMQGSKAYDNPDNSYRMWYLNLPVLARYRFANSGFFAETGPQLGLLLDANLLKDEGKTDVSESFKNTSINWNFGLGYALKNGLVINARVAPGLNVIEKNETYKTKQFTSALRVLFNF